MMIGNGVCKMFSRPRTRKAAPSLPGTVRIVDEARAVVGQESLAIFHSGRGMMFKANRAGAQIWQALASRTPLDRVADEMSHRYAIPRERAEEDIAQFVSNLRSAGLVAEEA